MHPLNATQIVGIVSFWGVAAASARAARTAERKSLASWAVLCVVYICLGFEVILGLRHTAHDLVDRWLEARGLYASRGNWQADLVVIAMIVVLGIGLVVALRLRRAKSSISLAAWLGTVAILVCFVIETISLHALDALMYYPVGPFLIIAFWWAGASAIVIASAIRSGPRPQNEGKITKL
jgi:hypothetical protein